MSKDVSSCFSKCSMRWRSRRINSAMALVAALPTSSQMIFGGKPST